MFMNRYEWRLCVGLSAACWLFFPAGNVMLFRFAQNCVMVTKSEALLAWDSSLFFFLTLLLRSITSECFFMFCFGAVRVQCVCV